MISLVDSPSRRITSVLVLLVGATVMGERPLGETRRLTMRELRMLADDAVKAQEVERAVQHLRAIQSRLQDENAYRKVEEEIPRRASRQWPVFS